MLTSANLCRQNTRAPCLPNHRFSVSKEPFGLTYSIGLNFRFRYLMTYHLFSVPMPILQHGNLYVKLFGGHEMQVCRAAQASSSEHLRTEANAEQTAQTKDLSMFLSNGDFS